MPVVETRLDDPEGDAADLQPIRSVDHAGQIRERRARGPRAWASDQLTPTELNAKRSEKKKPIHQQRRIIREPGNGENSLGLGGHCAAPISG
ncbi:MAG: hypothetical protein WKF84_15825 [Pyrinomonadaceae bacterium]